MNGTADLAFFNCPICGKRPYIKVYGVNYGTVYCKGRFFKRHPLIKVDSGYCQPSELYKKLSAGWNDSHWKTLNDLPINIDMGQIAKENEHGRDIV